MHLQECEHCAQVAVSEMVALCVPETDSSSCADLCEECGKELKTHSFVHIVKIDRSSGLPHIYVYTQSQFLQEILCTA